MNYRIFLFLLGFIFMLIGNIFIFYNLNLLALGYSFIDYIYYVCTHVESLLFFIGIILLKVSFSKEKKHDLYL